MKNYILPELTSDEGVPENSHYERFKSVMGKSPRCSVLLGRLNHWEERYKKEQSEQARPQALEKKPSMAQYETVPGPSFPSTQWLPKKSLQQPSQYSHPPVPSYPQQQTYYQAPVMPTHQPGFNPQPKGAQPAPSQSSAQVAGNDPWRQFLNTSPTQKDWNNSVAMTMAPYAGLFMDYMGISQKDRLLWDGGCAAHEQGKKMQYAGEEIALQQAGAILLAEHPPIWREILCAISGVDRDMRRGGYYEQTVLLYAKDRFKKEQERIAKEKVRQIEGQQAAQPQVKPDHIDALLDQEVRIEDWDNRVVPVMQGKLRVLATALNISLDDAQVMHQAAYDSCHGNMSQVNGETVHRMGKRVTQEALTWRTVLDKLRTVNSSLADRVQTNMQVELASQQTAAITLSGSAASQPSQQPKQAVTPAKQQDHKAQDISAEGSSEESQVQVKNCPICLEQLFTTAIPDVSAALPCMHCLCKPCSDRLQQTMLGGELQGGTCPLCRQAVTDYKMLRFN